MKAADEQRASRAAVLQRRFGWSPRPRGNPSAEWHRAHGRVRHLIGIGIESHRSQILGPRAPFCARAHCRGKQPGSRSKSAHARILRADAISSRDRLVTGLQLPLRPSHRAIVQMSRSRAAERPVANCARAWSARPAGRSLIASRSMACLPVDLPTQPGCESARLEGMHRDS
jgi:hypothetical protein